MLNLPLSTHGERRPMPARILSNAMTRSATRQMITRSDIAGRLRSGAVSCVEVVRQTIAAIEAEDRFNAFITITAETALDAARRRDRELARGVDRGPWHGIPVAYKDIIQTHGVRTTGASRLFADWVPEHDAECVERLEAAGAISVGKTNLHELAYGATSQSTHFGPVLNPRDPDRIPGGSSGGSAAAVAAGWLPMALGTDTGGSIRIPASYCGVVGYKPTYDLVSRKGVLPLSFSLDHIGPIGATVADCADAIKVLGKSDLITPSPEGNLHGLRICVPKNFFFECIDPEVEAAVRGAAGALANAGCRVAEAAIPDLNEANLAARMIQLSEAAALYGKYEDSRLFGADVWALIEQGRRIAAHEYVNAQRLRTLFRTAFNHFWRQFDMVIAPTTPVAAPLRAEGSVTICGQGEDTRMASTRLTRAIPFLGEPAISLPCGVTRFGLPIGLQMIAAPFADSMLLQAAAGVEALLGR